MHMKLPFRDAWTSVSNLELNRAVDRVVTRRGVLIKIYFNGQVISDYLYKCICLIGHKEVYCILIGHHASRIRWTKNT